MIRSRYLRYTLLLMVCALISGCAGTKPARFYTLQPLQGLEKWTERKDPGQGVVVAVSPIRFPDYLSRSEIATRTSQNQMSFSEFNLWAGSLPEDFSHVLVQNLSLLLSAEQVLLLTRPKPGVVHYQLAMEVLRFDGQLGGDVSLIARWSLIRGKERQWLFIQTSSISESTGGAGYEAFVGAQSRALERLSREIAEAIKKLPR